MDLSQQIRERGLKATPSRLSVMKVLESKRQAYAHADLESIFIDMDRVTLYRVLNDFEETGLVHKVIDMDGVTRFAHCGHSCPGGHHADAHAHFNCQVCHKMYCLENAPIPSFDIPKGFMATGQNILVLGLCKNCGAA